MSVRAYLIKKIDVNYENDEIIIKKVLNKTPSFKVNHEKILELFDYERNLNEDLNGELTMDRYTWSNILKDLDFSKYSEYELEMIENISNDMKDNDFICYYCF